MNEHLQKGLDILISNSSNPMALEALVKALEATLEGKQYDSSGVDGSGLVDAPTKVKHPLEDYKITDKDIGSLVVLKDYDDDDHPKACVLSETNVNPDLPYGDGCFRWQQAKPYLDPVALHFKLWHATDEDTPPSDLKDGEWFAILEDDGNIVIDSNPTLWWWNKHDSNVIGYRPLSFVNPIVNDEK